MIALAKLIAPLCTFALLALPLRAEPVTIFAASSLKTALDSVITAQDLDAVPVYGGSAALARQIAQGAEADIVILAHPEWMAWLAEQGGVQIARQCNLLGNALVLAAPRGAPDFEPDGAGDVITALDGGRLATGQLRSVPAGQYTAAYLSAKGWLETLRPHLAETSNVRLALALIARQEVPLGFVYASDIVAEPSVRALFMPDQNDYPHIRYPMALTNDKAATKSAARVLVNASESFAAHGFSAIPSDETGRCE